MGSARKHLDLAVDVMIFVAALFVLFLGFTTLWKIKTAQTKYYLDRGHTSYDVQMLTDNTYTGSELIARLLDTQVPVEVDGVTFTTGKNVSVAISPDANYRMEREYDVGSVLPSKLILTQVADD